MKHAYTFPFEQLILKPLEEADIEQLRLLRNREKQFFITQAEIDGPSQKRWYESYLNKAGDIMFKLVRATEPDQFIGAIALYDISLENHSAEFGRLIGDKELVLEKGVGLQAVKAICGFGFEVLKLETIVCEVLKSNTRAFRVYLKAGFRTIEEGENCYRMEWKRPQKQTGE